MARKSPTEKDRKPRCAWVADKPHFILYHDQEWGRPVHDDRKHFEMLILEGAQAGLSWETILLRREGYRKAFAEFYPEKVATFTAQRQTRLLQNPEIIRNRLKIASAITNAKAFLHIQKEFGSFNTYIWNFVEGRPKINHWKGMSQVPATSPESDALAKDLKKRGFRFAGSTIMYAHMQAAGLVNDHTTDCWLYSPKGFPTPKKIGTPSKANTQPTNESHLMEIGLKRIYDPPSPSDGFRVFIDRLWPRGLSKHSAPFDLWLKEIAPSTSLRKWFHQDPTQWEEFQRQYRKELKHNLNPIHQLQTLGKKGPLTLLYGSRNTQYNHGVVLKDYLKKLSPSSP